MATPTTKFGVLEIISLEILSENKKIWLVMKYTKNFIVHVTQNKYRFLHIEGFIIFSKFY